MSLSSVFAQEKVLQNSSAAAGLTLLLQLLAHCHCRGCLDMCPFGSTICVGINYEGALLCIFARFHHIFMNDSDPNLDKAEKVYSEHKRYKRK